MDSCSTPASAAAMHANLTPRTTRVTHTAHGDGARPHRRWCSGRTALRLHGVCVPSPPVRTAPLSAHCMASGGKPPANATGGSDVLNPSPPLRSRLRQCCCLAQAYSRET
eukprot:2589689-Pleurochrysis_carterae.AAC.1